MNLQRREEISVLLAAPVTGGAGQVLEYRAALMECRAHIDTLEQTAAERVIADGSSGPTPDYTGEGSAWVPPVEARAVVVPDDDRPSREFLENYVEGFDPGERSAALFGWREGCRHLREHSRAIPAGRVLGEGMLSIHPDVINSISDTLRDIGDTAHNASTGPAVPDVLWDIRGKAYEAYIVATDAEAEIVQTANAQDALSALRANQGGANE